MKTCWLSHTKSPFKAIVSFGAESLNIPVSETPQVITSGSLFQVRFISRKSNRASHFALAQTTKYRNCSDMFNVVVLNVGEGLAKKPCKNTGDWHSPWAQPGLWRQCCLLYTKCQDPQPRENTFRTRAPIKENTQLLPLSLAAHAHCRSAGLKISTSR